MHLPLSPLMLGDNIRHWAGRPVETVRYMSDNGSEFEGGETENAGIACYVCEYLCGKHRFLTFNERRRWVGVLVNQITSQAVSYDGIWLWRWERNPLRHDYLYPPDWDDTCKAIDALTACKRIYNIDCDNMLPTARALGDLLSNSIERSPVAGEEVRIPVTNTLILPIFMASRAVKANNTDDPHVTAVSLLCILSHYPELLVTHGHIVEELYDRLVEIASIGLRSRLRLSSLSRCYLSWSHYLWLIMCVSVILRRHTSEVIGLSRDYLLAEGWNGSETVACEVEEYYGKMLSRACHIDCRGLRRRYETSRGIMYQHRRLGHYYGSPALASLLHAMIAQTSE